MAVTETVDIVQETAERLENDVKWRGLNAGQRYLSAEEAGEMLGVSMATADRAMRVLTERGILIRQRGRGTFIGPNALDNQFPAMRSIQLLMPRLNQTMGLSLDGLIRGVHNVFPDVPVAINTFPLDDPIPTFQRIVAAGAQQDNLMGLGLILVPHVVQEMVIELGLPAVLLGTPFPGVDNIVSIDIDYHAVGSLLAQHLLDQGHCRFGLILRQLVAAGDSALLQGFTETLGAAGLTCDTLMLRHSMLTEACFRKTVRSLLSGRKRPTALFAYPYPPLERWLMAEAAELGLQEGRDFTFVTELGASYEQPANCPVRCKMGPAEVGEAFGHLLTRVVQGEKPQPAHTRLPVELV